MLAEGHHVGQVQSSVPAICGVDCDPRDGYGLQAYGGGPDSFEHVHVALALRGFGARFVELARAIYTDNDHRSRIKRPIDARLGSAVAEEKIHPAAKSGEIQWL